jgi:hypothetical protein
VPTGFGGGGAQAASRRQLNFPASSHWRNQMPVILWLLGVPLAIVLLLMLFGVI